MMPYPKTLSIQAVLVLVVASCCQPLAQSEEDNGIGFVSRLLTATEFDSLVAPIEELRSRGTADEIQQSVDKLLLLVESQEKLRFIPNFDSKKAFNFRAYGGMPMNYLRGKDEIASYNTIQDLEIVGGRCAWALERLLGFGAPPVIGGMDFRVLKEHRAKINFLVDRIRATTPDRVRIPQLTETDRLRLLDRTDLHPMHIVELSMDSSLKVAEKAAAYPRIDRSFFQHRLSKDPHRHSVRQIASDRLDESSGAFFRSYVAPWRKLMGINKENSEEGFLLQISLYDSLTQKSINFTKLQEAIDGFVDASSKLNTTITTRRLIANIHKSRDLEVKFDPNWDSPCAFAYCSLSGRYFDQLPSLDNSNSRKIQQKYNATIQDLDTSAGRAAWFLERLYGISAPPIHFGMDDRKRREYQEIIAWQVFTVLTDCPDVAVFRNVSEERRLAVADYENLHPRIVMNLANDKSSKVRLKAIRHTNLPRDYRDHLSRSEQDPLVLDELRASATVNEPDNAQRILDSYLGQLDSPN